MKRLVRGIGSFVGRPRRLAVLLAVVALLVVFRVPLLVTAGRWLDVGLTPERSDYVIFLPGGRQTRPFMAAALVNKGYAPLAVTCRTVVAPDVEDGFVPPEEDIAKATFERLGVDPAKVIVLPGSSSSTVTDAIAVGRFLRENPQAKCLVVTSDIHTRRARWTFEDRIGDDVERLRFVSVPTDGCRPDSWWQSRHGFTLYTGELVRIVIYSLIHPHRWLPAAGLLAVTVLFFGWYRARRRSS